MIDTEMLLKVEDYVTALFAENARADYTYHNLIHTKAVVKRAGRIAENSGFSDEEITIILLAAWFHDTGYLFSPDNHEERSIKIANEFFEKHNVDTKIVDEVTICIEATRFPHNPSDKIAEAMCDADMSHFAHRDFFDISLLLHTEYKNITGKKISKLKYWKDTLKVFEKHSYYTAYAKTVLDLEKQKNYDLLKEKIAKAELKKKEKAEKVNQPTKTAQAEQKPIDFEYLERSYRKQIRKLEKQLDQYKYPVRGIETMFRITGRNQINLSSIADNKANIMISVNAILVSIVGPSLLIRFNDFAYLILPGIFLLLTNLLTIIFGVLATRPNISSGRFTTQDVQNRKVNLLFFGNFYDVDLDEYDKGMRELMKDYDYLYGTLIKDQYSLGKVLARKYRLLRQTYNIFMFGIIISVLTFAVAYGIWG